MQYKLIALYLFAHEQSLWYTYSEQIWYSELEFRLGPFFFLLALDSRVTPDGLGHKLKLDPWLWTDYNKADSPLNQRL